MTREPAHLVLQVVRNVARFFLVVLVFKPRPRSLVESVVNMSYNNLHQLSLRKVDILPAKVRCWNGHEGLLRSMETSEAATYYQWLQDAMACGMGYGYDEFPTWIYFRHWLSSRYSFVLQDAATSKVLAFFSLGGLTGVSRSAKHPHFRHGVCCVHKR